MTPHASLERISSSCHCVRSHLATPASARAARASWHRQRPFQADNREKGPTDERLCLRLKAEAKELSTKEHESDRQSKPTRIQSSQSSTTPLLISEEK